MTSSSSTLGVARWLRDSIKQLNTIPEQFFAKAKDAFPDFIERKGLALDGAKK